MEKEEADKLSRAIEGLVRSVVEAEMCSEPQQNFFAENDVKLARKRLSDILRSID